MVGEHLLDDEQRAWVARTAARLGVSADDVVQHYVHEARAVVDPTWWARERARVLASFDDDDQGARGDD